MIAALRHRNFSLLWAGGLVSMVGDWALLAALPFYIYDLTGSALASSGLLIAYFLPGLLLGSVAGVFVDRWDRRRTMLFASLLRAPLMLLLLAVHSPADVWIIYLVAFCESSAGLFFRPAENALLPRLVGEELLLPANALNALNDNLARLAGPALGGALLGLGGLPSVVLLDSASYLFAAIAIALIRPPGPVAGDAQAPPEDSATASSTSFWSEWLDGLRLVGREPTVRGLFVVQGVAQLADSIVSAMLVVFVHVVLGAGAAEFGLILTCRGIGGLAGGALVGQLGDRLAPRRLLSLSLLLLGGIYIVIVSFPSLPLVLAAALILGVPVMGWLVSGQTLLQTSVPDTYRGRVFAAYGTSSAVLGLGGIGLAGALGDRLGAALMLNVAGGLNLLASGLAGTLLPASRRASQGRQR